MHLKFHSTEISGLFEKKLTLKEIQLYTPDNETISLFIFISIYRY